MSSPTASVAHKRRESAQSVFILVMVSGGRASYHPGMDERVRGAGGTTGGIGQFLLGLCMAAAGAQSTVRCESSDGRYVECRTGMLDNVTLSRTLNDSSCVQGQTWGFRNNVIWVDNGCRADFMVTENLSSTQTTTNDTLVVC